MSGGGVDWKEESLKRADAALDADKKTCAEAKEYYKAALQKLEEHMRANPDDTDSGMYKMLADALATAKTAYKTAQTQVTNAQDQVCRVTQQLQAPQEVTLERVRELVKNNLQLQEKEKLHRFDEVCAFKDFQAHEWAGLDTLTEAFKEVLINEQSGKNTRRIGVIASGMGDGKSRTLQELVGLLEAQKTCSGKLAKKNIVELRVTLENGTTLSDDEVRAPDVEKRAAVEQALIRRIVHRLTGESFDRRVRYDFTIRQLMELISGLHENTVIVLLIDGVHNFDPTATEYKGSLVQTLFHVVQTAILTEKTCVFAVCSATVKTDKFMAGVRGSPDVKKDIVAPPCLTKVPAKVSGKPTHQLVLTHASLFLGLAGMHPRALAAICGVHDSINSLAVLLDKGVVAVSDDYRYDTTSEVAQELLRCALSQECSAKKKVGGRTVEQWASHGLMRLEGGRLHMSLLFLLLMQKIHAVPVLQNLSLYDTVSNSRAFEIFIANARCLRGWAFSAETEVLVKDLHHGVAWCGDPGEKKAVGHAPTGIFVATTQYGRNGPLPNPLEKNREGEHASSLTKVVVNGESAPSADVFCTLKASTSAHEPGFYNDVVQAKFSWQEGVTLSRDDVLRNADAAAEGDVYILISLGRKVNDRHRAKLKGVLPGVTVGIVDDTNFDAYFGPFAPLARLQHKALAPAGTKSSQIQAIRQPAGSVLRAWTPPRCDTARAPTLLQRWVPLAVSPRTAVNLLFLRRARFAAKFFA